MYHDGKIEALGAFARIERANESGTSEFQHLNDAAAAALRAPMAAVSLYEPDQNLAVAASLTQLGEETGIAALNAAAARAEGPTVVHDTFAHPLFGGAQLAIAEGAIRSYLGCPISLPGQGQVGVLAVMDHMPRTFSEADAHTLAALARCAGEALDLRLTCATDQLTGLMTRRAFMRTLEKSIENVSQSCGETLALFDLDHFKSINDTYGHGVGDEVLSAVSAAAKAVLRDYPADVGRVGGEEFAIVFHRMEVEETIVLLHRLRATLAGLRIPALGSRRITASFGVSEIRASDTAKMALCRADEALYAAKEAGRNTVIRYRPRAEASVPRVTPPPWRRILRRRGLLANKAPSSPVEPLRASPLRASMA